ncbi:MAG: YbjN domain-containing protein [Acidobacteriota bacterium]|nr:MAG: YbjN domain-containing protein [Acidobacteriota bacterium]
MFDKVTVERVEKYLDRYGWKRHKGIDEPNEQEGVVLTGWRSPQGESHLLTIDPIIEKNVLVFKAGGVLKAPPNNTPADCLNGLLMALSGLNYMMILGKWCFDPRDGEVRFTLAIPIDEGRLAYSEFEHCLNVVVATVSTTASKLKEVVEGKKSAMELLAEEGLNIA